ncbi:MAG: hypothetical protein NTZ05_04155 [Chloroflexi bacterium]|nr:hypothetical protein [Chloroflexota bacterium]
MNVSPVELFSIIGQLYVETLLLKQALQERQGHPALAPAPAHDPEQKE